MNTIAITTEGIVKPDGTLEISENLNMPPDKVRVTVEAIADTVASSPSLLEILAQGHQELSASRAKVRTKAEIDADAKALRDEWEERICATSRNGNVVNCG